MLMKKTAILLVNLGTPNQPTTTSVRSYLKEFLSDRRVIDIPKWKWMPVLHGIILRARPPKTAALYQSIWTEEGSPLLTISLKQKKELEKQISDPNIKIALAMNYGQPSIEQELEKLHKWGMQRLILLPLFPQYSSTTTASIWDHVNQTLSKWRDIPEVIFIRDYPDHPIWIKLLKKRIKQCTKQHGHPDALLLSYHGIPERYAVEGDDYPSQCLKTTLALKNELPNYTIITSYQSKFGKEPWLGPSTSDTLRHLAESGSKHVHIMAPSFTVDCLETLEELEVENRTIFMKYGGDNYHYIEAANDDPLFIECLVDLIKPYLHQPYIISKEQTI